MSIPVIDDFCPNCIERMKWERRVTASKTGEKIASWFLVCGKCGYNIRKNHGPHRKKKKRR